jgi:hypothetical protein
MKEFFESNPGLKSRIAFHVEFPNYTKSELLEIAKLICKNKQLTLTEEAISNIGKFIDNHINDKDFGNGRFIRNTIEQSMMKQATRIITSNGSYETMSEKELLELKDEDIVDTNILESKSKVVGF